MRVLQIFFSFLCWARRWSIVMGPLLFTFHVSAQFEIAAPKDFANLLEPQTTIADIFYGGDFIGNSTIEFTPSSISFVNPMEVVNLMPNISDKLAVARALAGKDKDGKGSGKIPTNAHLLCSSEGQESCGLLEPKVAGVIFDETRLKVEVFIAREYLFKESSGVPTYLEAPAKKLSGIFTVNGNGQEVVDTHETAYTLDGNTIVALGPHRVRALTRYSNKTTDQFYADEIVMESDRERWRGSAGLLNSQVHQLIPQQELLGLRLATTLETRKNLDQGLGSEVPLFLPRRSYVTALRGNYLLASFFLPAGHHVLDTSAFPQGSYEITINIKEVGGSERSEKRYFSKSQNIPPRGEPQYYFEVGRLQDSSEFQNRVKITNRYLGTLAGSFRLSDKTALQQGWMWARNRHYLFENFFLLLGSQQFNMGGLISSHQDLGATFGHYFQAGRFYSSLNYSQIWPNKKNLLARSVGVLISEEDRFRDMNASLGLGLNWFSLSFRAQYHKNFQNISTYAYGPKFEIPLVRNNFFRLNWDNEFTWINGNETFFATRLQMNLGKDVGISVRGLGGLQYRDVNTQGGINNQYSSLGAGSVRWRRGGLEDDDFYVEGTAAKQELKNSYELRSILRNTYGSLEGFGNTTTGDGPTTTYGGNFLLNLLTSKEGVKIGGSRQTQSALVINLKSRHPNIPFHVYFNNNLRGDVKTGSSRVFTVNPYRSYSITIKPADDTVTIFSSKPQKAVLYPGTISSLEWEIEKVIIVIGRTLNKEKKPLAAAVIEEAQEATYTDDDGYFQAEVKTNAKKLTFTSSNGKKCTVPLPKFKSHWYGVELGKVICQ